jgi:hypothetical protein
MSQVLFEHVVDTPLAHVTLQVDGPFDPKLAEVHFEGTAVTDGPVKVSVFGRGDTIRTAVDKAFVAFGRTKLKALKPLIETQLKSRLETVPHVDLRQGDLLTKVWARLTVVLE